MIFKTEGHVQQIGDDHVKGARMKFSGTITALVSRLVEKYNKYDKENYPKFM